jgi:aryl-alcohol dehydrogenase-like predicted oxidoreductase
VEYRRLGTSNLNISVVSLGTWAFSSDEWWGRQSDEDSRATIERALELGINFIDTARVYGFGHSEEIVGKVIRGRREKIILATKTGLSWDSLGNVYNDLSPNKILKEFGQSLKALKTDYIDLYQIHWPDEKVSIKKSALVLKKLFERGQIKAVGVSNYSVAQMKEFMQYCPLHSLQPLYNLFCREIEEDILPFCYKSKIGIIVYSPLHSGILTGKFFKGIPIPNDLVRRGHPDLTGRNFEINRKIILEELEPLAIKYGISLGQLSINWLTSQKGITSAICGARNPRQIEENVKSVNISLDEGDIKGINEILNKRERLIEKRK